MREVTRIEGFSDAVFGLAITLLVVSLEVPASFDELLTAFRGLPVFAVTFAILLLVWQEHHTFFRRFGLQDGATIWLNGALLFVVMVYIYPLKFLFALLAEGFAMRGSSTMIRNEQVVSLMVIYGTGFAAIFLLLAAMYWRAARRGAGLGFSDEDRLDARDGAGHCLVYVGIAGLSILLSLTTGRRAGLFGGLAYGLIGPAQAVYHVVAIRRRRQSPA